jgi:hypothetical protein
MVMEIQLSEILIAKGAGFVKFVDIVSNVWLSAFGLKIILNEIVFAKVFY